MRPGRLLLAFAVAAAVVVSGCGDDGAAPPDLDVAAATSLRPALLDAAPGFAPARVRLATGGSDQLAARIRAGARPDVFVAADAAIPRRLEAEGLVERPVTFATNELVLAVPASASRVGELADLAEPGVRIAAGSASVPVGAYADAVLARLGGTGRAIERNIATREPDVAGVLAKLRAGAVDAGFVYRTDVRAAGGRLRAITLPAAVRPPVRYAAAVVRGTDEPGAARAYVRDLRAGAAADALVRAGFGEVR
ncbi:MAG: molybdate ABC transporter substrate-binding protein [Solirubrobacteraceae bacterium]|jgi:molybdate transport system substrate-binding protein|nr:molybdate ABC transporter substrate-binding protein [Solirubrobacteraceae bacterium]MCU0313636.1 molybdate ABC transporter substrate-binding protein [Solirubrobacteraceae bacterium]